ncbi:putative serine hydrolase [Frankliniella fusca]|uniref:Serine hydrolase n=1 Tax=Frankliniella fusca TaxID=407009 RepID=A0AAE1HW63_9NEOP|nr:putative serine hydrolase [Frankliniella fusca]
MFRTTSKLFTSSAPVAVSAKIVLIRWSHTEVKIPVAWGHIAGKWWNNDGRRPILAVHGWQDNANSFDAVVPLMSSKLPVLAIDLPGHGRSSYFPEGFPYHRMTAIIALKSIMEHFDWQKVSLMGHSLGGQTCLLFSTVFPEQVDSLATLDILAPIPMNSSRFVKSGGKTIDEFLKRDAQKPETAPTHTLEELVEMIKKSPISPVSEVAAKALVERGSVKCENGKFRWTRDPKLKGIPLSGWTEHDILKFCEEIKTNVLCIKAESSSYFSKKEFFEECWSVIKRVAKTSDLRYAPGGHDFHLEHPEIIAPILDEFFRKHYNI